jgi:hypothetical protein
MNDPARIYIATQDSVVAHALGDTDTPWVHLGETVPLPDPAPLADSDDGEQA